MQRTRSLLITLIIGMFYWINPTIAQGAGSAVVIPVNGPIGPVTQNFVNRGISNAEKAGADLVILQMDTPGGLDKSMRGIIQKILGSTVPVATFVSPAGARAASAGTYILYASHVAAMAPGTNLGAATPVSMTGPGGDSGPPAADKKAEKKGDVVSNQEAMRAKVTNDAVAYIEGLAKIHGRNSEWAKKSITDSASLSSEEALKKNVIDLMAVDLGQLLQKIDGRTVVVNNQSKQLATKALVLNRIEPDWRNKFLSVITDPSVAYILMLIGIYGLFFEFANPGFVLPGVAGAICIVLALYAFQLLPISFAGLGLMILGMAFMVGEAFLPSFGVLGIGGFIAFVIGSVMLMDTNVLGLAISWQLIAFMSILSAAFFTLVMGMAIKSQLRQAVSGREGMIGKRGTALEDIAKQGNVRVDGEVWQARCDEPLTVGTAIRVEAIDGLTLIVKKD